MACHNLSEADTYGISPEYLKELQGWQEIDQKPVEELSSYRPQGELFNAEDVKAAAEELIGKLGGFVFQWELCGGYRRGSPMVHDGDIVLWTAYDVEPDTLKNFQSKLVEVLAGQTQAGNVKFIEESLKMSQPEEEEGKKKRKRKVATKPKAARKLYRFRYNGIPLEINIAKDEQQFEVLKFIRTGPAEFHKSLLMRAQSQNMTVNFHHDDSLNMDLYGLYGAIQSWQEDKKTGRRRPVWVVNPTRLVAWREQAIIEAVYGHYIEPANREPGKY